MSERDETALRPCPFCDGAARPAYNPVYNDMSMASCRQCGAEAFNAKWNSRTADVMADEIERLREALTTLANAARATLTTTDPGTDQ